MTPAMMSAPPAAATSTPARFVRNVLLKAVLLFVLLNGVFMLVDPLPALGRLTIYNVLLPGRVRLPYGEDPAKAYNLSLYNLDAMLASHEVARPKAADEYRVVLIGDSSVWGFRLPAEHTLGAYLNGLGLSVPDGRRVRVYNLGYPILSVTKDLLLLSRLRPYQPDLILWCVTLESFPADKQLFPPLVQNNASEIRALIARHHLRLDPHDPSLVDPSARDRTLWGRRRALADLLRLQLFGVLWAATGIDQDIPETFTPRLEDLPADTTFHGLAGPELRPEDMALDVLAAGVAEAGPAPVVFVNEPMFVSGGENSNLRYNFFYPRWAYDGYRAVMQDEAARRGWTYVDLWDAVPNTEYTDSAIHLTPLGSSLLAERIGSIILEVAR
jgi:hypothetical protein